jgi:hypothetical protein
MPVDMFLILGFQSVLDPKNVIGYFIAGAAVRNPLIAATLGGVWALATVFYDTANSGRPADLDIAARLVAGIAVAAAVSIATTPLLRRTMR